MAEQDDWIRVPVGREAGRWATRGRCRRVLLVLHNVTAATRLLDVLPLFRDDLRVQLLASATGSSPFQAGLRELLDAVGVPVLPWGQAVDTRVDLAVSASFGGRLAEIKGPLVVMSHGTGYNKLLEPPGTRRRPRPEGRAPAVFGMAPEWLLADGVPIADALVFSHPEQVERLRAACPQAAPTAVLGGDPCFDRVLAARHHRDRYRRALGVRSASQRLVVLNSTWNPDSLFGDSGAADVLPFILRGLTAELPVDEYRVAAVLHPNIWSGHGPGQLRLWLDRARRAGLALVDPLEGWRQALIAADAVIGDFGSVSYYAAALGVPVLRGSASPGGLAPDSPVARFVRSAPRLDPYAPVLPQIEHLVAEHRPLSGPAELVTSDPGQSAALLRELFYGLMGIPEPEGPALLDRLPLPPYEPATVTAPLRVLAHVGPDGTVGLRRFAEPAGEPEGASDAGPDGPGTSHLVVHEDTLDPGRLELADIIHRHGDADDPRLGPPAHWTADVLDRYPGCSLTAYVTGPASCTVRHRGGLVAELTGDAGVDPVLYASALMALTGAGTPAGPLPAGSFTIRTGATEHRVVVSRLPGEDLPAQGGQVVDVDGGLLGAQQRDGLVDQA